MKGIFDGDDKINIETIIEVKELMELLRLEPDEDSCTGMSFVHGRVCEESFYNLYHRLERIVDEYYEIEYDKERGD